MITVYGLKVSYFTGKLEGYLRYKEIPYAFRAMTARQFTRDIPAKTGAMQMPAVKLADGRWLTDTTPMIEWFETQYTEHPILPADPLQAFLCRLIEDYADEWLWRPAMHYRWSHKGDAQLLRRLIAQDMGRGMGVPGFLLRMRTQSRQYRNYVAGDGVTPANRAHVERGYTRLLEILSAILRTRPFLFGARPSLADIGLFGPLFRHFSMDPTPAAIMREEAPEVMAYVLRLWTARASQITAVSGAESGAHGFVAGVPEDLAPLLSEIAQTHLPALAANAAGWANAPSNALSDGRARHGYTVQGARYDGIKVSRYRVWCLERLQSTFAALPGPARAEAQTLLGPDAAAILTAAPEKPSGYTPADPFDKALPVYEGVG